MGEYFKSMPAAGVVGTNYPRLMSLIRSGKIAPPRKDSSGDYLWSEDDLAAARKALATDRRRRKEARSA